MKMQIFAPLFLILTASLFASTPSYKQSTGNSCFKSRDLLFTLEETFDGLKQTLMQSNLNIVTVTKADGVLTAKGNQYNNDEETIIGVTVTIDFKERSSELTTVKVIASYETIDKKNDTGQIGGGGISLPIPVPFTGKYTLVGQGNIDDSNWYRGFFNSLDKILFENRIKYDTNKKPEAKAKKEEVKKEEPNIENVEKIVALSENKQTETILPSKETIEPILQNQIEQKNNSTEVLKDELKK